MERLFARQRVINPSRFDAKRENHLLQADCSRQRMFGPYANRSRGAQALSRSRIGQETRPGRPRARTHCSVEDKAGPEGLLSGEIPGILIYAIYVLRAHRSLSRRLLCCFPLVVLQQAPQSFSTPHCSHVPSCLRPRRKQDPIAFALMVVAPRGNVRYIAATLAAATILQPGSASTDILL